MTEDAASTEAPWRAPASFAQERMWFLEQLQPGSAAYNIPVVHGFGARVSRTIVERCLVALIERHESLRTRFAMKDGRLAQLIDPHAPVALELADMRGRPARHRERHLADAMEEKCRRPFDLARGPLMRATLFRIGANDDRLLLVLHHVIADAWSVDLLLDELRRLYDAFALGRPSPLAPLRVQYADWAAWQRSQRRDIALDYWRGRLDGALGVVELPTDRARPAVATLRGTTRHFAIPGELARRVSSLAAATATSGFAVYLAAYALLLARQAGIDDLLVGCPTTLRVGKDTQGIVGLFLNTLPLRIAVAANPTVTALLNELWAQARDARDHGAVPLEELIDIVRPERSLQRHPLFQLLFSYEGGASPEKGAAPAPVLSTAQFDTGTAKFDISLLLAQHDGAVAGAWEFATDLFDPATIARFEAQYLAALFWLCDHPDSSVAELVLIDGEELASIERFERGNPLVHDDMPQSLSERVARQAARTPDALALVSGSDRISYAELVARSDALAGALLAAGTLAEERIGILLPRGTAMVVAVLAVLRAGAAYVPIDPALPADRIGHMVRDSVLCRAIATPEFADRLPPSVAILSPEAAGEAPGRVFSYAPQAAYVLYTSGSTGRPKGVVVPHEAVCAFLDWARGCFSAAERRRVLAATSLSFDLSVFELFLPLTTGGTVVLADSILALVEPDAPSVTLVNTVPSAMREVLGRWQPSEPPLAINLAGEPLSADLAAAIHARFDGEVALRNLYGPTETTIYSTGCRVLPGEPRPSIGRPIDGTTVRVLDPRGRRTAIGEAGELHIGGDGVARGYCNNPAFTAERYVPDPHGVAGSRMYRTGDLVRWTTAGTLEFLGRTDNQVKLRGFRIELGEIEAALRDREGVDEAVALLDRSRGDPRIVAFVSGPADIGAIEAQLRRTLPCYMVPDRIELVATFPRTTSGKIDRKSLRLSDDVADPSVAVSADPRVAAICEIFAGVLGIARVSPHDNFFELGGHSLVAVRVSAQIEARLGLKAPLAAIFGGRTAEGIAALLEEAALPPQLPVAEAIQGSGEPAPLSRMQAGIYFFAALRPTLPLYNMPVMIALDGSLPLQTVQAATDSLVDRHEALRLRFDIAGGQPRQWADVGLRVPLRRWQAPTGDPAAVERAIEREIRRPFDLRRGPPVRATLIEAGQGGNMLLLVLHHIIGDGRSADILATDFLDACRGLALGGNVPARQPPPGYLAYCRWQQETLDAARCADAVAAARDALSSAAPVAPLPTDRPRVPVPSHRGDHVWMDIPEQLGTSVATVAQRLGVSSNLVYLSAFAVLLGRMTGEAATAVGMPVLNRDEEWQHTVGLFTNTVPVGLAAGSSSFAALIDDMAKTVGEALDRSWLPFEMLVEALAPPRMPGCHPLFQVMYAYQEARAGGGTRHGPQASTATSKFDLSLNVTHSAGGGVALWEFATDLFDATSVERIGDAYVALLEAAVAAPNEMCASLASFDMALATWCSQRPGPEPTGPTPFAATPSPARIPASDLEHMLVEIWREVLGHADFHVDSNFFDVGGNSLAAMVVASRIAELGYQLPLEVVFTEGTIGALAQHAQAFREGGERDAVLPIDRGGALPASWAQERLLILDRLQPGQGIYNIPVVVRWSGQIDRGALERAIEMLADRHETLRSRFVEGPDGIETVIDPILALDLGHSNVSALSRGARESEIRRIQRRTTRRAFDLERGPLLRGHLVDIAPGSWVLFLCIHHIVADALSIPILQRELRELYEAERLGDEPALAPLDAQFSEYVAWQRRRLSDDAKATHVAFWREQLADAPTLLPLPTDRPRPSRAEAGGRQLRFALDDTLSDAVRRYARSHGTTPFTVLMSAYALFLAAEAGVGDLVIGIPIAGRPHRRFEPLIGFFSNTLPLRLRPRPSQGFGALVRHARDAFVAALEHQDLPFEAIVQEINPERTMAHHPLFQAAFAYAADGGDEVGDMATTDHEEPLLATAKFDLTLFVSEGRNFSCALEYRTDLFDPATIRRFAGRLRDLVTAAMAEPDAAITRIGRAGAMDLERIAAFNRTERHFAGIEFNCAALAFRPSPEAVAVIAADGATLSYAELLGRAGALAARIRASGCTPGTRIAIAAEPDCALLIAVLATWLARCTCVTLDPDYPRARLDFMLADSRAQLLLGSAAVRELAPGIAFLDWSSGREEPVSAQTMTGSPAELAYIVYTSGSTGVPKGIAMPHGALLNLAHWEAEEPKRGEPLTTLQFVSPSFDVFFQELLLTLATGGALCLVHPVVRRDPPRLLAFCRERRVGRLFLPFVALRELAEAGVGDDPLPALREVITAGEQLQVTPALRRWFAANPGCRLINQYGPAETHVVTEHCLARDPADWPDLPPIGRPIANTAAHVLDADQVPCPVGVAGELYLSGACLAQGYAERPALTAERFLPGSACTPPGTRMYRTGDRARWLVDGTLAFLGRVDRQVKIRGYRVEPAEVEAALHALDGVAQAVVMVRKSEGEARLEAFVLSASGADIGDVRSRLARTLPEPLVPSRVVPVAAFPRTPSGKIDRRALLDFADMATTEPMAAVPMGAVGDAVAALWRSVLDRGDIEATTSFFAAGGHSLSAVRMIGRLSRQLGAEIPLAVLFDHPRLAEFVTAVVEHVGSVPAVQRGHLATLPRDGRPLPASWIQRRFWVQARISGPNPAHNLVRSVFFAEQGGHDVLTDAVRLLAGRHEALRTRLGEVDGEIVQLLGGPATVPIDMVDLDGFAPQEARHEFAAILYDEAQRGYDLARDPLFRATIVSLGAAGTAVLLCLHHAIADGRSLDILERDLSEIRTALLDGDEPELPALDAHYADFAERERTALDASTAQALLDYWSTCIADYPQLLQLGRGAPVSDGAAAGRIGVTIGRKALEAMRSLAARHDCTLFAAAIGIYAVVLAHLSGERRLLVGAPWGLRDDPVWEDVVGPFVNTLVLPVDTSGDPSFAELLTAMRARLAGAHAHALLPFDKLVEHLRPARSGDANPLVQFAIGLHHGQLPEGDLAQPAGGSAQFHASLVLFESDDRVQGVLEYDRMAVPDHVAATAVKLYERLFMLAAAAPERSIWEVLVEDGSDAASAGPSLPAESELTEVIAGHAARQPDAIAVEAPDGVLSYARLEGWSNWLARRLRARCTVTEARVGVLIGNSRCHALALLSLLKAGLIYVPLDPALPEQRLRQVVAAAGIELVLTVGETTALAGEVERWRLDTMSRRGAPSFAVRCEPAALAYILFTSGSTGTPRGVMITRDGMRHLLAAQPSVLRLAPGDRWLKFAMPSFDAALFEMIAALSAGATLCLEPEDRMLPGRGLARVLRDRRITATLITPSALALLPQEPLPDLALLCVAGEACPAELVRRWGGGRRMLNLYGPAEMTIWSTWHECVHDGGHPPIGLPVANMRSYILDTRQRPVPAGGAGELCLGGPQLARGYLGSPGQTATAFVPDPFGTPGSRLYRTGDLVRAGDDGVIEFLGRIDQQIKVRGVRIEPREIEEGLRAHPSVGDAVAVKHDGPADGVLVAYVVGRDGQSIDGDVLLAHLAQRLPRFMLPSQIIPLQAFPRTPSGKLARNALPLPTAATALPIAEPERAVDMEERVCAICTGLLGREVTPGDNFFALGGHSLLVVRLLATIETDFGVEIQARSVFDAANVRQLCAELAKTAIKTNEVPRLSRKYRVV